MPIDITILISLSRLHTNPHGNAILALAAPVIVWLFKVKCMVIWIEIQVLVIFFEFSIT